MRVGRYPSMREGGSSWSGVICDTNAPEEDHWWAIMSGEVPIPDHIPREQATMLVKPDNWKFYTQPAAMTENLGEKGEVLSYSPTPKQRTAKTYYKRYYPNIVKVKQKVG